MASRTKTRQVFIELIDLQLKPHNKTYKDVVGDHDWYMNQQLKRKSIGLYYNGD